MPDKLYWEQRQEQKFLAGEQRIDEYYKGLEKAFEQSRKEIQKVINEFYSRYASENGLSFTAAQRALSNEEIGTLKQFIALVNVNMGKYNQELNNMSIKARITRYQALEKQIDALLQQLYAIEYQYKGEEALKNVYSGTYYQTWFDFDQYRGFHQKFAQINPASVEELIKYPFNGADYSTRLWKQKDHMLQQLSESITTMLIQGKNPQTLAGDFAKKFGTKTFEAYRLLHTEGAFMIEQGTLAAYKEEGVKKYQILATLDHKTSDICREEDGNTYDVDKAVTGVNYPPFHNFCRTTTTPSYEDLDNSDSTRVARDPVTGKSYEVPADMKYKEWHEKYIESNPEAITAEKKWKNRFTDRKQFVEYKSILGKDAPNSLDNFQNLKYNNSEDYRLVNIDYSRRKKLIDNSELKLPNIENATVADEKFTKYLFGGNNKEGLIKGRLITEKLGYDINNYEEFKKEILKRGVLYPAKLKSTIKQGHRYETRTFFYSKDKTPINVEIGWLVDKDKTHMTSVYINEVKKNED